MATYSHRAHLKYTPEQLFDLVAGVEKYPEFIPWMIATRVRRRTDEAIWTDLTVGTGFLRSNFRRSRDWTARMDLRSAATTRCLSGSNRGGHSHPWQRVERTPGIMSISGSNHCFCRR